MTAHAQDDRLRTDVVVRAWTHDLSQLGAEFTATVSRRPITFTARVANSVDRQNITLDGIAVIGESGAPHGIVRAIDATVRAIPEHIKLTILTTPELIWQPVGANRDAFDNWHIEAVPYVEWLRLILARTEPKPGEK